MNNIGIICCISFMFLILFIYRKDLLYAMTPPKLTKEEIKSIELDILNSRWYYYGHTGLSGLSIYSYDIMTVKDNFVQNTDDENLAKKLVDDHNKCIEKER